MGLFFNPGRQSNSMKILVLADIHGERQALSKVIDAAEKDVDLVICPGDFTDMFNIPQDFTQMDVANLVIQQLLAIGKPVLCVPGNHDPYEIIDLFRSYGINLHGNAERRGNTSFLGFGGAATPFNTIIEPSEKEIAAWLDKLSPKASGRFVLVVHNPPKNTKLDKIKAGHVGSQAIRDFIEAKKPALVLSAHIHENAGEDKIGTSTIFYPGPVYDGYYGVVEIKAGRVSCESKQAKL